MNKSPKTIHALIVGIDDYAYSPLQGCVNDALAVGAFFDQYGARNGFHRNVKYLLAPQAKNAQAVSEANVAVEAPPTRQNIIAAFDAFGNDRTMRAGDVFLFYYSGHGSQETAAPEFRHLKADGLDEAFDCLDSAGGDRRHLLDKELAWLLWRLWARNPDLHLLVVTDCCHSGNNTRGGEALIQVRRGKPRAEFTPFRELLGVKDVPESDRIFTVRDEKAYFRAEARHIHLAAARDNETAKETLIEGRRRGVFTWSLLRVLECGGTGLSYLELLRRTEAFVRNRVAEQIPQLEALGGAGKTDGFLGGAFPPAKSEYPVQYATQQWRLAAGRLAGIVPGSDAIPALVTLNDGRAARIKTVEASYSILDDAGFAPEDRGNTDLRAVVSQMPAPAIRVYVEAGETARRELEADVDKIKPAYADFSAVSETDAEFTARRDAQQNWMLLRRDSAFPVFLRQSRTYEFVQFCDAVGKYRFVLELENADTRIDLNDLEIDLEVIEGQPLSTDNLNTLKGKPAERNDLVLHYRTVEGKRLQPALRCKVRPKQKKLWIGGLFLDNEFGITHSLADRELSPGQEHAFAFALNGVEYNAVPLSIKPELLRRGVTEITDYLKIFVSDTDFKLDDLAQPPLPLDTTGTTRSIGLDEAPSGTKTDWTVITIPLKIVCPPQIAGAQDLAIQDFTIVPPPGFTARYALSSRADARRKLDAAHLERSEAAALQKYWQPPASLWGEDPAESQVFSRKTDLRSGSDTAPSILELVDMAGQLRSPLVLAFREKPAEDEAVIAIGYDPDTGLYFPTGFTNADGDVEIFTLPPETPGQIFGDAGAGERSAKRSVKLFFRKLVRRETVNALALVRKDLSVTEDHSAIRAAIDGAENILLLTHGIFGNTEDKKVAVMRATDIHEHYDAVLAYEYENLNTGLRETARDLFARLKKAGACEGGRPRLTIVAPSMGGLVCRWMIEVEEAAPYVKHLVMVATPNLGTELSAFRQRLFGLFAKALTGVTLLKPYLAPLSFLAKKADKAFWRTLDELHPTESKFLAELNARGNLPPSVRYSLLGGDLERLTLSGNGDGHFWKNLKKCWARTVLDWLVFEGAHDMAVELSSQKGTRWLRPENTVIVPVDHLGYFVEKEGLEALHELLTKKFFNTISH